MRTALAISAAWKLRCRLVSQSVLNCGHEPSSLLSGDDRINADFAHKARDARRRGNVELKWLEIGDGQPHELPAFP